MAGDHAARDRDLFGPGPKRILSLDGGGVRGVISLAYEIGQYAARRQVKAEHWNGSAGAEAAAML